MAGTPRRRIARRTDDNATITYALPALGSIHQRAGRIDRAESCYAEALERSRAGGEAHPRAKALIGLAWAEIARRRRQSAQQLIAESITQSQRMSFRLCEADGHAALAELLRRQGHRRRAERAMKVAHTLYRRCRGEYEYD